MWRRTVSCRTRALVLGLCLALVTGALASYTWAHRDYYRLGTDGRPLHPDDSLLRSSGHLGLRCAMAGTALCTVSALYLLRRLRPEKRRWGPMPVWLDGHVLTGWTGAGLIVLHSALTLRSYLGSLAALSLVLVVLSGSVGRVLGVGSDAGPVDCRPQDIPPRSPWTAWRFWHRWAAVLFVAAVLGHILIAVLFGDLTRGGGQP